MTCASTAVVRVTIAVVIGMQPHVPPHARELADDLGDQPLEFGRIPEIRGARRRVAGSVAQGEDDFSGESALAAQ